MALTNFCYIMLDSACRCLKSVHTGSILMAIIEKQLFITFTPGIDALLLWCIVFFYVYRLHCMVSNNVTLHEASDFCWTLKYPMLMPVPQTISFLAQQSLTEESEKRKPRQKTCSTPNVSGYLKAKI